MKYILETTAVEDVFRTAAEEDGSPGCKFLLLRRKIGFLLKIEKEMVEYWTKDTKVFKEVQNMPARTKIIAAYPSLSPAERQAADFILSDPDAVPHLSIKQIAARAGVSMPTVTRLVRRAGYSGFTELRIALAGSFTKNKPVASGDDDGEFFSKLMLGQMRSVEAALKAADEERICALAKRLVTSTGCVLLCGAGAAAGIAESAGSALVELGIRAVCPQKPETRAAYSALLGEGDTLFCIRSEGSRESAQQLTECIRTAKRVVRTLFLFAMSLAFRRRVKRIAAFAQHAKAIFADFWVMQHRHRLLRLRKLYSRSRRDMREKFRRTHTGEECSEQLKGNINKMRIIEDLHTHTYYSHGQNGPRDNVLRALELGLEAVAVSEHAGGNMYYGVRGKKLERLNAELAELRREFDGRIRVLRGLECNVMNFGESDIPKDRSEYDVIILGYHKGIPPVNRFARHILFESFGGKSTPRRNTESLMAAAEKGHADIISHPNLYLTLDIPYLADCARQLGILLEINSSHVSLTPEEIKTIHEHGAGLIIGSDAHVSSRVGDFANGIESAKQAGVLNSVVNIEL